jgi:septum site-determining protein MinC
MAAELSQAAGVVVQRLRLSHRTDGPHGALAELRQALETPLGSGLNPDPENAQTLIPGPVELDAGPWRLDVRQLEDIEGLLESHGLSLVALFGDHLDTRVAAAGMGLPIAPSPRTPEPLSGRDGHHREDGDAANPLDGPLHLHRGTLRSGDHLEVEGSLLLLGDVNPGASVRASGHVMVWGRLRGTAHAGSRGHGDARIIALQLRPLQLRIAKAVARGPEGVPPQGLAEEAALADGVIQIRPASPGWPLGEPGQRSPIG